MCGLFADSQGDRVDIALDWIAIDPAAARLAKECKIVGQERSTFANGTFRERCRSLVRTAEVEVCMVDILSSNRDRGSKDLDCIISHLLI